MPKKIWHEGHIHLSLLLSVKYCSQTIELGHIWSTDEDIILSFHGFVINTANVIDLNGEFFGFSLNEIMSCGFFDIWLGQSRQAKWAKNGVISTVSTEVMAIFLVCLLLPTLLNKSADFLNLLVWAFIYIKFNGHLQNLGMIDGKTWIL